MVIASAEIISRASAAPLPVAYEHAKTALAECEHLDECREWANKADALASYARQADDETLEKHCTRIKARAIRRCGELLKEVDRPEHSGRPSNNGGGTSTISQRQLAKESGLSKDQQTTAVRVANVPIESFERQIDSDDPPTVTKLAEQGKKTRAPLIDLKGRDPKDFAASTRGQGALREFAKVCDQTDWDTVVRGAMPKELEPLEQNCQSVLANMKALLEMLK